MSKFLLLPVCALVFAGIARADTITLASGEKIDGKVINESDTEVTVQVQISGSITDERTIQRSEIAKIEKEQPDAAAFAAIKDIRPDPQSSYPLASYDRLIAALQNFVTTYPASSNLAQVRPVLDALTEEKKRVASGDVKILGKWISKEEAEKRKVQIQGQQLFATMKQQTAQGDMIGALDTFATLERTANTSAAWPSAIELAKQLIARLQQDATNRLTSLNYEIQQFNKNVIGIAEPERSQQIAAAKQEQDKYAAVVNAALRSGRKWVPFIPRSTTSLTTLQKTAQSEAQRINALPVRQMLESIRYSDQAEQQIASQDFKGAGESITQAQQLWPQNEEAQYLSSRIKEDVAAAATPTPSATPKPKASATPVLAVADEEEKSFFKTIPGALTILGAVVLVIGVASLVSRQRARKAS